MASLIDRIEDIESRARDLEQRLADPDVARAPAEYARLAKQFAELRPIAEAAVRYRQTLDQIEGARSMLSDPDPELRDMARAETARLQALCAEIERSIHTLLVPRDPNDDKNVILEIRAGAGGEEAALFAGALFRMYSRYAEAQGWKIEPLSISGTGTGGIKEGIASISGDRVYSRLKHERGVHRVQRVPVTESQGRIHTSTVTVAVLPEPEAVEVDIDANDLRIDVFRASGPGGQSVNTTDSAVRITHLPTGLVVQCQDEKSQHKNKARALKILRARYLEAERERQADERASERRAQVGTADRSERIRTYNFPQSRVTDHRAGVTVHPLEDVLEGRLDELLDGVHEFMLAQAEVGVAP